MIGPFGSVSDLLCKRVKEAVVTIYGRHQPSILLPCLGALYKGGHMADGKDAKKRACHIYTHADMGEVNECRVVTTGPTFSRSCSENHRIMLLSNYIVTTRPTRLLFINLIVVTIVPCLQGLACGCIGAWLPLDRKEPSVGTARIHTGTSLHRRPRRHQARASELLR